MAGNAQIVRLIEKRRETLVRQVSRAEESIKGWKGEIESLDAVVHSLRGLGAGRAGRTPRTARRGTWRLGHPGRPPKWYVEQQKGKGKSKGMRKAGKRKRRASAKMLASLAKARAALAAKRKDSKSGAGRVAKTG